MEKVGLCCVGHISSLGAPNWVIFSWKRTLSTLSSNE